MTIENPAIALVLVASPVWVLALIGLIMLLKPRKELSFKGAQLNTSYVFGGGFMCIAFCAGFGVCTAQAFREQTWELLLVSLMFLVIALGCGILVASACITYDKEKRIIDAGDYVEVEVVDILKLGYRSKNRSYVVIAGYKGAEYESKRLKYVDRRIEPGTIVRLYNPGSDDYLIELPR